MAAATATCQTCDTPFTPRAKTTKYCTPLCSSRGYNARRKADGRLAKQRRDTTDQRSAYMASYRRAHVPCAACGSLVERNHNHRYRRTACSGRCMTYLKLGYWPSSPVPDRHPSRSTPLPDNHPARQAKCTRCNVTFSVRMVGQIYCTNVCQGRAHSSRRDARKRGQFVAEVSPQQVYERDGWRCQLCGKKLKRNAVVPHPLAPTIDHVIPLALGGTHEPANAQAAHFLCNALKSDKGGGEQLALIG